MFSKYREAGFAVIPSREHPLVKWKPYQEALPSEADAEGWDKRYGLECTYELVCGKVSGVVALDIDTDDAALIAKVEAVAGVSPVRKFGTKGYTAFYRYDGQVSDSWGGVVEILSDRHLCAIPPGKHRKTGKPYVWLDGDLLDGLVLPSLGAGFIEFMNALYPKPVYEAKDYSGSVMENVELDEIADMLDFISADGDRHSWVRIGMALRSEFGDEARPLWHKWSATSAKYKRWDADNAWRSFGASGVGIGTLVWQARQGGYMRTSKAVEHGEVFVEQPLLFKKSINKNSWANAGGMVGAVAGWVSSNAIIQQPAYAFATALSIVSIIKSGKVWTTTNLHPNIYVMCLGPTGSGKDNNLDCADILLKALGMKQSIMGKPASGPAVATGLLKAGCTGLLKIDEVGRFFAASNNKNAQAYQTEIIDLVLELYGRSGGTYYGKQYADEKNRPQIVLEKPYMSVIGFSVKERMLEACSGNHAIDGFLNRWMIFETKEVPEESFPSNRFFIPDELIEMIKAYGDGPGELKIGRDVWALYKDYRKLNNKRKREAGYPLDSLYQRLQGQALKLCMLLNDDGVVKGSEMRMAIDICEENLLKLIDFSDNITDNQHEADLIYVLDVIKKWPGIITRDLTSKTRRLKARERGEILSQLEEMGQIRIEKKHNGFSFFPLS